MNRVSELGRNLVQDLRDRNLLIPAIALLAAIVAVPILLGSGGSSDSGSGSSAAPVPTAPASMSGAEEVQPVVLADVPGLRNYRKRLNGKNGRNPFIQQSVDNGKGKGGGDGSGGGSGGGGSSTATTSASTSTSGTSSSTSSSSSSSSTPAPDSSGGGSSGGGTKPPKEKQVKFTIDVRVGRSGKTKVLKDVEPLALLPGKKSPVVQFVGSDETRASFAFSPDTEGTQGDGECMPSHDDCQYLTLEVGDLQKLYYGKNLDVYRLELLAINKTVVPFDAPNG